MTRSQSAGLRAARIRERDAHLRSLGYKGAPFPAKFSGGKCGISGLRIVIGEPVAFFREHGLCLDVAINDVIRKERDRENTAREMSEGTCVMCSSDAAAADSFLCPECVERLPRVFEIHAARKAREATQG